MVAFTTSALLQATDHDVIYRVISLARSDRETMTVIHLRFYVHVLTVKFSFGVACSFYQQIEFSPSMFLAYAFHLHDNAVVFFCMA